MSNKSSITKLPKEVRESVDRAIREDRATIDEIVGLINELGADVSRSAVGRYVKNANDKMEQFREAQAIAKTWIGKFDEERDGDVGKLLIEMLRTVAFQSLTSMDEGAKPSEIQALAKAIQSMASADKTILERELRIRQEVASKAADKAEKIARKGGMTSETVDEIRREILGIAK